MGPFLETLKNLGPIRLAVLGGVMLGLIAFFIYLTTRLTTPDMALLYGDLTAADSGQIIKQLEAQEIPYDLRAGGSDVYVPGSLALRLRVSMAEQGLPSGGSVGYEIFDKSDNIGTTSFVQNINLVRALEGELARTVRTIGNVRTARVHLVLPKRELFSRDPQQPSASVVLQMQSASRLNAEQIMALQHLVAAAVPGLTPARVSIVDQKGSLLARGFDEAGGAMKVDANSKRIAYENRLARTIETLLEKSVGFGKVRAEITADMNFNQVTTSEEIFDPEGQVVRSTQSVEEQASAQNAENENVVSVETNLPDIQDGGSDSANSQENTSRAEETVNFEISKTITSTVREAGIVTRLSVAVLVDGTYAVDGEGTRVYNPRSQEQMDQLATLVRTAIGYDTERGDTVEVINMQFVDLIEDADESLDMFLGFAKEDLMRLAEILVLSVVAILIILLVVRPLITKAFDAGGPLQSDDEFLVEGGPGAPALAAPGVGIGPTALPGEGAPPGSEEELEELIDIDRVEGRVKASSVKKVGEIVEKHPEEALSIIRNWMYQEGS